MAVNVFLFLDLSESMTQNGRIDKLNNVIPDLLEELYERAYELV